MSKILLFGATGHLGKEIAKELKKQGFSFTAVVRNAAKAEELTGLTTDSRIADPTNPNSLAGICIGCKVVISSLGKSVSLNERSKKSFRDIDLTANSNILNEAQNSGVRKFIYVSAFQSEAFQQLEYFATHHEFSEKLKSSGLDYSIIKPPALFSAFQDLIEMAKKGMLMNIGAGNKITNPIYEGDLAVQVVRSIGEPNTVIEAGGPKVYTRRQLNEIILQVVRPYRKLRSIPIWPVKTFLPLLKWIDKNTYDKLAFYLEVMQHDLVAPKSGVLTFEEYVADFKMSMHK